MMTPKVFLHVDLDAFFAAVEQRDNPLLKGKPVVVGADPKEGQGRGVVSTCSYEARKYGIHSAMPISLAYKLCSSAVFLPVDFDKYLKVSGEVFKILEDFTPDVEPVSIDEAFLDITGSFHLFGTPYKVGQQLKEKIQSNVHLTASVGIAPIKMLAKIASDYCKPDGLLEITPDKVFEFLWPLSIDKLWGVGPKTQEALNRLGIKTVGDLAHSSLAALEKHFGENGRHLYDLANGRDPREVKEADGAKSVSHEHTFEKDTSVREEIKRIFLFLSEQVSRRLRKNGLKGKTLTLKVRLKGFKTYTHSFTFPERTNHADVIFKKAREIFEKSYPDPSTQFRLIGVRLTHFEDLYVQDSLFEDAADIKQEKVHKAVDRIKDKFGDGAIHRAG
jgi:DNA polymerase-4